MVALIAVLAVLLAPLPVVAATGMPQAHCTNTSRSGWMSWLEVGQSLERRGMRLVRLRVSDYRCFIVTTQDTAGTLRDLTIHPVTGDIIDNIEHQVEPNRVPWRWTGNQAEKR